MYVPLKKKQAFLIFLCMSYDGAPKTVSPDATFPTELVYKNKRIFKRLEIKFDVNTSTLEVANFDKFIQEL